MQIIGEKINGTRKAVADAIARRDTTFISNLATRQTEAGTTWLDVNAGTPPKDEPRDLVWLVETIQAAVDTDLCLDSANPKALSAAITKVNHPPMINSINGEPSRLETILPLVKKHGCPVIALAMDDKNIPSKSTERMKIIRRIMDATRSAGVPDSDIYIDPLVMAMATSTENGLVTLETMRTIRQEYPKVSIVLGLSNISFGLPARSHVNQAFLTLALSEGLEAAIMDPLDTDLQAAALAGELLLGKDRYCLNYTRKYRGGKLGKSSPN